MTLEKLAEADTFGARTEIMARLTGEPGDVAEVCRQLDRIVDEQARRRSASWSQPEDRDSVYHSRISTVLRLVAQGLEDGQGPNAASVAGWEQIADSSMLLVQAARRRALWGTPLPSVITDALSQYH